MNPRRFRLAALLCLAWQAAGADEAALQTLPLIEQSSGAFYVRAVFGREVASELLVDTGSSYVALSKKTFDRLRDAELVAYVRTIHGTTATGRRIKVKVYAVESLALGSRCVLDRVEAVVLPGADRDILGLSALRQMQPFSLAFEPPTLSFSSCSPAVIDALSMARNDDRADSAGEKRAGPEPASPLTNR